MTRHESPRFLDRNGEDFFVSVHCHCRRASCARTVFAPLDLRQKTPEGHRNGSEQAAIARARLTNAAVARGLESR